MVVGLCSIIYANLGDVCEILEHLYNFREVKYLQGYSKTLWMGI